ncbi:MAG: hypothetical protein NG747_06465 [Candidatus Brocadia sp.]|nr:hypothetical protein [Candidatus Brocadia sp.]
MTRKVVTAGIGDTLLTISMIFKDVKVHHILVVDNRLMGGHKQSNSHDRVF